MIANLDAAVKFYGTVNRYSNAETIRIGNYQFTGDEKNKLLGLTINYNNLRKRFGIPDDFVDYTLTKEFLRKCLSLLYTDYGQENSGSPNTGKEEDDFPF